MKGFLSEERPIRTLREVMQRLKESYCGSIGYEVIHSSQVHISRVASVPTPSKMDNICLQHQ